MLLWWRLGCSSVHRVDTAMRESTAAFHLPRRRKALAALRSDAKDPASARSLASRRVPTLSWSDFDAAYRAVLSLTSKGADLIRAARERDAALEQVRTFARRMDLDLDALPPVVHIAGTKGKGSTAVMCESMLRAHGLRTGLFTSPHLCNLRERFRLDGRPVAEDLFLRHFWDVWDRLVAAGGRSSDVEGMDDGAEVVTADTGATGGRSMPPFFRFLTLLGLHLFSAERVDVIVLEVGLGGRLDATNVVPSPVVTAVTTLDLDHVAVLGGTLAEIAREKAGIFKKGVPAFTVPQEASAMAVLREVAESEGAPLHLVTPTDLAARHGGSIPPLGLHGDFQHVNAAVAVALANEFLRRTGRDTTLPQAGPFSMDTFRARPLSEAALRGLATASWPGRAQIMRMQDRASRTIVRKGRGGASTAIGELPSSVTFFIDGAHTTRSMEACAQWFASASTAQGRSASHGVRRVLLFNCGHEKSPLELIEPLRRVCDARHGSADAVAPFDRAVFCPFDYSRPSRFNPPTTKEVIEAFFRAARLSTSSADSDTGTGGMTVSAAPILEESTGDGGGGSMPAEAAGTANPMDALHWQTSLVELWKAVATDARFSLEISDEEVQCRVQPTIADAVQYIAEAAAAALPRETHVLVAGSLYLVGGVLDALGWDIDTES